jgi:hypothetical protein
MIATLFTSLIPLAFAGGLSLAALDPHPIVDSAIAAMQRTASLRDIRAVRLTGIQHEYMFGNAERTEGPWRVFYAQFTELRDISSAAMRRTEHGLSRDGTTSPERVTVLADSVIAYRAGARELGGSHGAFEDAIDRVDGSPARALLLASSSRTLTVDGTATRYGLTYDVVSFPWRNGRMRIEINRATHLPDAVEIVREYPDNFRWAPLGRVTMRADYVDWTIQPNGAYWPMQEKISLNGEPLRDITFGAVAFDAAAPAADSFAVSDSARLQFAANSKLGFSKFRLGARGHPTELVPGIVRVPDQWMMTLVKQSDGVVIFETHISAQYLHDVIDEAHRRWPGVPIKAIVMTSDPWGHLGGFPEAAKLGVPIYVSAASRPFLSKLTGSAKPRFMPVRGKTVIGTGDNAIELYPVGGPYAERMLMAYFPTHRLLYGADLVFLKRGPDGKPTKGFLVTEMTDLRRAVEREGLSVDKVFCVQNYGPFAWSDFIAQ